MLSRNISLKPFKYDRSDDQRIFDIIRAIIIYKECKKINFNGKKILGTIRGTRLDIPQYIKLKKKISNYKFGLFGAYSARFQT